MKLPILTEEAEQRVVAQWLDLHKILWFHVPNGGLRNKIVAAKLVGQGVKPGVSDIIILDPPPRFPDKVGVAIELKRRKGGKLSEEQRKFLISLAKRNWLCYCIEGADDAMQILTYLYFKGLPCKEEILRVKCSEG